jgi:hypothetical protein
MPLIEVEDITNLTYYHLKLFNNKIVKEKRGNYYLVSIPSNIRNECDVVISECIYKIPLKLAHAFFSIKAFRLQFFTPPLSKLSWGPLLIDQKEDHIFIEETQ